MPELCLNPGCMAALEAERFISAHEHGSEQLQRHPDEGSEGTGAHWGASGHSQQTVAAAS